MDNGTKFRTARGYELAAGELQNLTASMEDYLEMIFRLERGKPVRTSNLADALSVNRSSVTKMVKKMGARGLVESRPYGEIMLTPRGMLLGEYLFERHEFLTEFLSMIGVTENILQEVEGIEHNLSQNTLECIKKLVSFAREHPGWWNEFNSKKT